MRNAGRESGRVGYREGRREGKWDARTIECQLRKKWKERIANM